MRRELSILAVAVAIVAAPRVSEAAPLTLYELGDLLRYVKCVESGNASDCGAAPARWEKNQVAPVDRTDYRLALAEYEDEGRAETVCYRDAAQTHVVFGALCPGAICEATAACSAADCAADAPPHRCLGLVCEAQPAREAADCADADDDGFPRWLEEHLGTSDEFAQNDVPFFGREGDPCSAEAPCNLYHRCEVDPQLATGLCVRRDCGDDCTVFHLEKVAEDDQQLLVHVFYDYSPTPATVLDLRLRYDQSALALEDARPLPLLRDAGKSLGVSHRSDGVLRLSVYSIADVNPVPFGAVIELIFRRQGSGGSQVAFVDSDATQRRSMAPRQGDPRVEAQLADDALWGDAVTLSPVSELSERLRLWYSFDDPARPLLQAAVPDAEAVCARLPDCAGEPDPIQRARFLARLGALQQGRVAGGSAIDGVERGGVYLNGDGDHLALPLQYEAPLESSAQSLSMAMWFYSEGNTSAEDADAPQLIFSHNALNERTRFGLRLRPADAGMDLELFSGDVLDPDSLERVTVAEGVALREWHQLGFSLDTRSGELRVYFDGEVAARYDFPAAPPAISCPGFSEGVDLSLHEEGDVLGGRRAESVYFSATTSGLGGIRRSDPAGLGQQALLADRSFSYRDPDYSPLVDRLVYVSNVSGDFEVWMARGDGSGAEQLTAGFGDTARGIFARRPRWAPDATGIVFESNVFDALADHNDAQRGSQLYFIGYDPVRDKVAIELEGGGVASQLDYAARIADDTIGAHQLTRGPGQNTGAWWLQGQGESGQRGTIVFDHSDLRFDNRRIQRLEIPENLRDSEARPLEDLAAPGEESRLLAARRNVTPGAPPQERSQIFYAQGRVRFEGSDQFEVALVETPDSVSLQLTHTPTGYAEHCWDLDADRVEDPEENRSQLDPLNPDPDDPVDVEDCYPTAISNLLLRFDSNVFELDAAGSSLGDAMSRLTDAGIQKQLVLSELFTSTDSYIGVELRSPTNAVSLPAGELATVALRRKASGDPLIASEAIARRVEETLFVRDLVTEVSQPFALGPELERIAAATFSPDGERLLLAGISGSRPILLATRDLTGSGGERIVVSPTRVQGLSWTAARRFYPCNWIGGYVHPSDKRLRFGLRGGVDELRIFSGVRDPDAFRSEAARGHERLRREGRDGAVPSRLPRCNGSHADCPPFHLCFGTECRMQPCDPADYYACRDSGGRCSLRPPSIEQAQPGFDWVCAADCVGDRECFSQQCSNGPCRFCDDGLSACIECRDVIQDFGSFQIASTEGCPDRNAFACETGTCTTECYSLEDGQSRYLCDPTLEYCRRGRCELLDWDWEDLAPATFGGLSETQLGPFNYAGFRRTVALGERSPVEIIAYGATDYGRAPELVIEARTVRDEGSLYGGDWFRVGRIQVRNRNEVEANQNPYFLELPHPITELRARLVQSPYRNLNAAATGLGPDGDAEFCASDLSETTGELTPDTTACVRRQPGSTHTLGYPVGFRSHDAGAACRDRQQPACAHEDSRELYLQPGQPAVIITRVEVRGEDAPIAQNRICSYEGGLQPQDGEGLQRRVHYGDPAREQSNAATAQCARSPELCAPVPDGADLLDFLGVSGGDWALLNCNFRDATREDGSAIAVFAVPAPRESTQRDGIVENANSCFVELDAARRESCFEWIGAGVSLDSFNEGDDGIAFFRTLEFSLASGFAHDEGFDEVPLPVAPLTVRVVGMTNTPPLNSGLQLRNRSDRLEVLGAGDWTFRRELFEGQRYDIRIEAQPEPRTQRCAVLQGRGVMPAGPRVVEVLCVPIYPLLGTVTDLQGEIALQSHGSSLVAIGSGDTEVAFPEPLAAGERYEVQILRVPAGQRCVVSDGQGVMPEGGGDRFEIACESVELRPITVEVEGLAGSGLVLIEEEAGTTTAIASNGLHRLSASVFPGEAYSVAVQTQPGGPAQTCTVEAGAGTMPNHDQLRVAVRCETLPTYVVAGEVYTLLGRGLVLGLDDTETLEIGASGPFAFSTQVALGHDYAVTVLTHPQNPGQRCDVFDGEGVAEPDDDGEIRIFVSIVCIDDTPFEGFQIGGEILDLRGSGLRLSNMDGERLDIDVPGVFRFGTEGANGDPYDVAVVNHPQNPTQRCTVERGRGRINGANVHDVVVRCEDASRVQVEVEAASFDGSVLFAWLATEQDWSEKVAVSPMSAVVEGAIARFDLHDLGGQSADGPVATIGPGNARLFVFINDNNSGDATLGYTYQPGEHAAVVDLSLTPGEDLDLYVPRPALQPTAAGVVRVSAAGAPSDAPLHCYWSPEGALDYRLPPRRADAIVARSEGTGLLTTQHSPLPAGRWALTCWIDSNDDGGLNAGDFFGTDPSVDFDGSESSLTLQLR